MTLDKEKVREALATMPHNRLSTSFAEHLENWWKAWGSVINAAARAWLDGQDAQIKFTDAEVDALLKVSYREPKEKKDA